MFVVRVLVGFVLGLGMLGEARAQGAPRRPALHWSRGERATTCIDPRTLAARVEALTGTPFVPPVEADLSIEGHIEGQHGGQGYRVRITVSRAQGEPLGERVLEHAGDDCRAFDPAIVFVIALTIDPNLDLEALQRALGPIEVPPEQTLLSELEREAEQAPPGEVERDPDEEAPSPAEEPLPRPAPASVRDALMPTVLPEVGIALLMSANELPRVGFGAAAEVSFALPRALRLSWWTRGSAAPRELPLADGTALRAQTFASALLLGARFDLPRRLTLGADAGPELAVQRARGLRFAEPHSALLLTYGAVARVQLSVGLGGGFRIQAYAYGRWNAADKHFVYELGDQSARAYRIPTWAGGGGLGVSRAF